MSAPATNPFPELLSRFEQDESDLRRYYDVNPGSQRFDRLEKFYSEAADNLKRSRFAITSPEAHIDFTCFQNYLNRQIDSVQFDRSRYLETEKLLPFGSIIEDLEYRRRSMAPLDTEFSAKQLEKILELLKSTREGLNKQDSKPSAVLALRAAKRLDSLDRTLDTWFRSFDGYKPDFTWWCRSLYQSVDAELKTYNRFLRHDLAGFTDGQVAPLIGDPIGKAKLDGELKFEMLDWSVDDLLKIADREYAWCETEMKKASKELGYGDDWKAALEHVKTLHVPAGAQDDMISAMGKEAEKWVMDRDLVTVDPLCLETWHTYTMSPDVQRNMPFSGYFGQAIGVSQPHDSMDLATREMVQRGNNIHFTRAIVGHELIPGHHLQGFMADRYATYRRMFSTPFYLEGWALYWEMLFWDMGFARNAEDKIGMLFWRMHRCARIVVSLKFHLGQMSPPEMIDYLVDKVGHERWTATSEVRRFIGEDYSPLYQCAYLIGGLQIRDLYDKYVKTHRLTAKEFHDTILKQNSIPIKMVGEAIEAVAKH